MLNCSTRLLCAFLAMAAYDCHRIFIIFRSHKILIGLYSFYFLLLLYTCVHVYVHVCLCLWQSKINIRRLSQPIATLIFKTAFPWPWGFLIQTVWLPSEPQVSSCLCLPGAGIPGVCCRIWIFDVSSGDRTQAVMLTNMLFIAKLPLQPCPAL